LRNCRLEPCEISTERDEQTIQNQHLGHAEATHGRKALAELAVLPEYSPCDTEKIHVGQGQ
jgi:hypothetical protein